MIVSLEEAKNYLRVDGEEDDELINSLLVAAENMCVGILRESPENELEILKVAVLYAIAYLYEHREEAEHKDLIETLRYLLSAERKAEF